MNSRFLDQSNKAQLFDAVLSSPTVGVALVNSETTLIYCNATLEKLLGYGPGELIGKSFLEITHPSDVPLSREKWDDKETSRLLKRYLSKKGEIVWVNITVTHLAGSGSLSGLTLKLVQDVTEAQQALRKLKESDMIFRQLTENISSVFWMTDPAKRKMLYLSPAYEAVWGLPCEDVYADPLLFVQSIHPDDRDRVVALLPSQIEGKYNIEYRITRPDGCVRVIRDRAFPVPNENGEIYRVCGVAQDITELKENERIMAEQQMHIMASAKLSSLGEMAASIAHEINSPLAAIQLNAEMLREALQFELFDRSLVEKLLTAVESTVVRITKIVRSLRRLGRNSNNDPFETAKIRSIVEETVELCRERLKHHSIQLEVPDIPAQDEVECRSVEISQLLLNLLNNAHDAVENETARWIRIEFSNYEHQIELAVSDSGPGIPPEIRHDLFLPFVTSKEIGKGTGLGLPICASIAKAHQGSLRLDEKSTHTRFVVTLPKKQSRS